MASDILRHATRIHSSDPRIEPGAIPSPIIPRQAPTSQTADLESEFFRRLGVPPETREAACALAEENGTSICEELIASGALSENDHAQALAAALGVRCLVSADDIAVQDARTHPEIALRRVLGVVDGAFVQVLDAQSSPPVTLAWTITRLAADGSVAALAPRHVIDRIHERVHGPSALEDAVSGMQRATPEASAATPWRRHQILTPIVLVGLVLGGLLVMPERTLTLTALLMGLPFLSVTVLRLIAFREVLLSRARRARPHQPLPPHLLPRYCVLVPLYRETEVLPDLVAALVALDYPVSKLDVILLIEASDLAMQSALLVQPLPPHIRVLVVPDRQPRTKPKALNYGLQFARGEVVVVFDAEDRPQPQQLKRAAETFARGPAKLACVQAQLNMFNPADSWFTRQFTIEYSTLFDAVLPALERLALPIPLGGTSNHFRRSILAHIGAWDPHNVTEDADLGIRIARHGFTTCVIPSTTWEEAPASFRVWLPQRTRWLKGWMQTWLVHTREPGALRSALGLVGAAGVHAVMGGLVVSALVQPMFLALLAYQISTGTWLEPTDDLIETGLVWVSLGNLAVGYLVSMSIGMLSVGQRGRLWLAPAVLGMPLYWLLISMAAYRALYQLARDPFMWEKTPHGAARAHRRKR